MQDFTAIDAKLQRAEENIHNLYDEMERFFAESDYPDIPENDSETLSKAVNYHKNLIIPPRFSVLSGEVIHHLRSCFDHIVWHFSVGPIKTPRQIEFPVFDKRPDNPNQCALYERKIQGVTDSKVRGLIERLQPYNAADPTDDPLWLINDFDIFDKHKKLILCIGTGAIVLPREMQESLECYQRAHPELNPAQVARHFKNHGRVQPCVSFKNFGRREVEPVSEGLIKLFSFTISAAEEFMAF